MLTKEEANVAANLRKLLSDRNLSVNHVAQLADVPQPTLHRVIAGERSPRIGIVAKIARALGVSVDSLLKDAA